MIIFLYGPDTFRSQHKLHDLQQKFIKEVDASGQGLVEVEGTDLSLGKLNDLLATNSLFISKRLIIVRNIFAHADKNFLSDLLNYVQTIAKSEQIVVFYDQQLLNTVGKNKTETTWQDKKLNVAQQALFNWLKQQPYAQYFAQLSNTEVASWIKDKLAAASLTASYAVSQFLVGLLGNDLWLINNELDKLIAYHQSLGPEAGPDISLEEAEEMVKGQADHGIFALTDALSNKNKAQAVKLLSEQLTLGTADYYLITMLIRQFRILLQIRQGLDVGWSSHKLGSELGLHPYVLQKGVNQARNFTLASLKNVFAALVKLDYNYKTGRLNVETMVDLLIVSL